MPRPEWNDPLSRFDVVRVKKIADITKREHTHTLSLHTATRKSTPHKPSLKFLTHFETAAFAAVSHYQDIPFNVLKIIFKRKI